MPDFLKQCDDFIPSPGALIRKYNPTMAYIWGVVWKFCQEDAGLCTVSSEIIANRAGVSRRSTCNYLKRLIADGFIEDLDRGVRNRPHRLCTVKGEDKIIGMRNLHTVNIITKTQDKAPELSYLIKDGVQTLHTKQSAMMAILGL